MERIKKVLHPNKDESSTTSPPLPDKASPVNATQNSSKQSKNEANNRDSITPTSEKLVENKSSAADFSEKFVNPSSAIQTQKTVAPVTHNTIQREETEEVTRAREHEKHIHHVQHHVQPVKDKEVLDEVHHTNIAPTTVLKEKFASKAEDAAVYEALGSQFKDSETHADTKRAVVDLGEQVNVKEHHHIHNVIQPVVHKETHDRHRIHTTVPIHHITHEAPIVHSSINHEPLDMDDFLKRGGTLASNATHTDIGKNLLTDETGTNTTTKEVKNHHGAHCSANNKDVSEMNGATRNLQITV